MFSIKKLDSSDEEIIKEKINKKTKPIGSLGKLEHLALKLALITGKEKIKLHNPTLLIFAGDHGIAKENISIAPSEVTKQMVLNFLNGGAAINCFCNENKIAIEVIDAGILSPLDNEPRLTLQRLGPGTKNFINTKAMSMETVVKGLKFGANNSYKHADSGCNVIGFGEMGIGNTSSAAAIMKALTNSDLDECVGRGSGIDEPTFQKKLTLIKQALEFHRPNLTNPKDILSAVGGFEIVQMVGAMLAAAEKQMIVLVDGFIASAAALVATKMYPEAKDYMVFCHRSQELGHRKMLRIMDVDPLLSLDMRLGEGTGAAIAYPLLKAAACFYNEMASFETAGIKEI